MANGVTVNGAANVSTPNAIQSPTPPSAKPEVKQEVTTNTDSLYVASSQVVRYFGATSSGATHLVPLLPQFNKGVLKVRFVLGALQSMTGWARLR